VLCIFGEDEETNLKDNISETTLLKIKIISGSHRFNNNMNLLNNLITQAIEQKETKSP
jgi:type IV secretory pathway VirJ component